MNKNVGTIDKGVRIVLAIIMVALIATGQVEGLVAIVLAGLAGILAFTSLMGWCPLYLPFGLSSRKKPE